ncbi:HTH domain-containing protein [Enterococcus sp.]|uniref:HTH domain-containing protein n=1 Tax=Enterococcus sp. TaxID=35783 RepID=UPI002912ABEA|nr:HTH domain-containing protein [Enterococcus sp.]MDU5332907.1 HTH domain-containing protein [Enterococcus sp.]
MIWQLIISKKTQQYLQLLELINDEQYKIKEMAKKLEISIKTVRRSIGDLEHKGYVVKETSWRINRQHYPHYLELHRTILTEDPLFQLFKQFLWGLTSTEMKYTKVRRLNRRLISLNLWAKGRTGNLLGDPAIILFLQLRYLREFYYFDEWEIYQQMDQYYKHQSAASFDKALFPDNLMINHFIEKYKVQEQLAVYFFFDHLRYHFVLFTEFYHCHQKHQTVLYLEVRKASRIIEDAIAWESELLKNIFRVKLFDLFIGIHQGLPLALFNAKRQQGAVTPDYQHLSKELKRQLPMLNNSRIDELALALKNIVFASHQVVFKTTPNLESSLLIQERYQTFLADGGN